MSLSLAVSPCSNPELELDPVLAAYARLGFTKFEVFTSWTKSAFDIHREPSFYVSAARKHGITFSSMHLPQVTDDLEHTVPAALDGVRFAAAIGAPIVLFKASSRENYIRAARQVLDAAEKAGITAVLQNHAGMAISTLDDYRFVLDGIADPRMKALLEVGHFHSVGVSWRQGYELLKGRIALVHIKDQIGAQSVPFGTGEIDLPGLVAHMGAAGYRGDYVVEMEVKDKENTIQYLADALRYMRAL